MNAIKYLLLLLILFPGHSTILGDNLKDYSAISYIDLLPLAEEGDPQAQVALGVMYSHGQGIGQDFKEAVKWLRLAAKQGNGEAQYNLGAAYGNGQGVQQDFKKDVFRQERFSG